MKDKMKTPGLRVAFPKDIASIRAIDELSMNMWG